MKPSSAPSSSTDRVIESFQQTMQAFLEVQKSTMLAYLAGGARRDRPSRRSSGPRSRIDARRARQRSPASSHSRESRPDESPDGADRPQRGSRGRRPFAIIRPTPHGSPTAREREAASDSPPPAPRRHRIARRSPPGCSRPSAIGPATRSRPWGSTSTWKPTWESTRSSGSRSWGSCAMNFRA